MAATQTPEFTLQSTWACLPAVTRGERVILSADPAAKNFVYCNGLCVIIRDLMNPEIAKTYTGHKGNATVARYSPSGNYVASGDERGKVQIWAPDHETMMMKHEYPVLGGRVRDIAWDSESKRLIAVGEGREKYGHPFSMDTGTSIGAIQEHLKTANTVAIRQVRPIRAATGSDDMAVNIHTGIPFKLLRAVRGEHTRFVSCVAYSPDNVTLASAALDGKIIFYDAVEGTISKQIAQAHNGGIYGLSWSPDSRQVFTSSADCTVKLWDVETSTAVVTWEMGKKIEDQQLGNLWAGEHKISVALSGQLSYLDEKTGGVQRTIHGHQRAVGALHYDRSLRTIFSGSQDGRICAWDETQTAVPFSGAAPHAANVSEIVTAGSKHAVSIGADCRLCKLDLAAQSAQLLCGTGEIPKSAAVSMADGAIYVGTAAGLVRVEAGAPSSPQTRANMAGESVAISHDGAVLAVGGERDSSVRVYDLPFGGVEGADVVAPRQTLKTRVQGVAMMCFSPDGTSVAVAGTTGTIYVHSLATREQTHEFSGHASRVTGVAFSSGGLYVVSCGVDSQVIIWSMEHQHACRIIRNAHHGTANSVVFEGDSDDVVVSSGSDGCIKTWKIQKLPGAK